MELLRINNNDKTDILKFLGFKISVFVYLSSEGKNTADRSLKIEY